MTDAVAAIGAIGPADSADLLHEAIATLPSSEPSGQSFAVMLRDGLASVEGKIDHANMMVRDFAVDETVPIHQVTIALEEARMGVELAMQVRQRMIEGYREIMNMQL